MSWIRGSLLRRAMVALVMLALSLAGIGRGFAATGGPAFIVVDGFVIALCHTDDGKGAASDSQKGVSHDCCDQCTLRAAADMPVVPLFAPPARIDHFIEFRTAAQWQPVVISIRTPRLSQGPPAA